MWVRQPFPGVHHTVIDPFVLLDEFVLTQAGFAWHPHLGFEKVTYLLEGALVQRDSLGREVQLTAGGAHHLLAGCGVEHAEERVPGRIAHGVQVWVNLPRDDKEAPAASRAVAAVPSRTVAGACVRSLVGPGGAFRFHARVAVYDVCCPGAGVFRWPNEVSPDGVVVLYPLFGRGCTPAGAALASGAAYVLSPGILPIGITHPGSWRFLLLVGCPLGQPVSLWGGYVD
ncbi:pirin family protein [Alicyclobacillus kakegawensis]|uniref:pirin family protein n=1 Tax=Alicyclobacillus kakegawensis TaxID=392012 RepID=UPI00082F32B5|nr:pirin family protein [Alicyclobacillus kakegawensis]